MRCAPLWPVGYDSLTGQDASEYAGTMRDETTVGVLAGAVDSTREECGCSLSCYKLFISTNKALGERFLKGRCA